jgi:hypothetical protein
MNKLLKTNQTLTFVRYKREFVITEFVLTEFDCSHYLFLFLHCKTISDSFKFQMLHNWALVHYRGPVFFPN